MFRNLSFRSFVFWTIVLVLTLTGALIAQTPPVSSGADTAQAINADKAKGIAAYNHNDYKQATKDLQQAVKRDPGDAEVWCFLGLSYVRQSDKKKARAAFNKAVALKPDYELAYIGLAYAYVMDKKYDEAETAADAALRVNPKNHEGLYLKGLALWKRDKFEAAAHYAGQAIAVNPNSAPAHLLFYSAQRDFVFSLKAEPFLPSPRAELNEHREQMRQATQSLETYLRLIPKDADVGYLREELKAMHALYVEGEKSGIYTGKEVDTKAVILAKPEPAYTDKARGNGTRGRVILRVALLSNGTPNLVLVLKGLPNGLTEKAITAARAIKFTPAMKDGAPVSQWIQVEYNFNLY